MVSYISNRLNSALSRECELTRVRQAVFDVYKWRPCVSDSDTQCDLVMYLDNVARAASCDNDSNSDTKVTAGMLALSVEGYNRRPPHHKLSAVVLCNTCRSWLKRGINLYL